MEGTGQRPEESFGDLFSHDLSSPYCGFSGGWGPWSLPVSLSLTGPAFPGSVPHSLPCLFRPLVVVACHILISYLWSAPSTSVNRPFIKLSLVESFRACQQLLANSLTYTEDREIAPRPLNRRCPCVEDCLHVVAG